MTSSTSRRRRGCIEQRLQTPPVIPGRERRQRSRNHSPPRGASRNYERLGQMVEFALPKNSRISGGKTWPKPAGATDTREFNVYRWNPDDGKSPSVDTYYVDT